MGAGAGAGGFEAGGVRAEPGQAAGLAGSGGLDSLAGPGELGGPDASAASSSTKASANSCLLPLIVRRMSSKVA